MIHRAVLAAGAADRDGEIAAVARLVLGDARVDELRDVLDEPRHAACASRKRITSGSRPVSLRSVGSQYGFGSERASNTKSASPGMPCLKPKDSNSDRQAAGAALLDALADELAQLVHAHARGVDDQVRGVDDRLEQPRSMAMASRRTTLSRLIGCLRRVSAKRRSSSSSLASRNSTSQWMPLRLSSSMSCGTVAISAAVLRASRPMAVRSYVRFGAAHACAR